MFPGDVSRPPPPPPPDEGSSRRGESSSAEPRPNIIGRTFNTIKRASRGAFKKIRGVFSREGGNNARSTQNSSELSQRAIVRDPNLDSATEVDRVARNALRSTSGESLSQSLSNSGESASTSSGTPISLPSDLSVSPDNIPEVPHIEGNSPSSSPKKNAKFSENIVSERAKSTSFKKSNRSRNSGGGGASPSSRGSSPSSFQQAPGEKTHPPLERSTGSRKLGGGGTSPSSEDSSYVASPSTPETPLIESSIHDPSRSTKKLFKKLDAELDKAVLKLTRQRFVSESNPLYWLYEDLLNLIEEVNRNLKLFLQSPNARLMKRIGDQLAPLKELIEGLGLIKKPELEEILKIMNPTLSAIKQVPVISYPRLNLRALEGLTPLASGATADIFVSPRSEREVVKVFKEKLSQTDIANLVGESGKEVARRLIALNHPNLVPIYDIIYNADGTPKAIEMPLIEGKALFNQGEFIREIEDNSLKWSVAKQVCLGLGYMHSKGLVHRDVQAKNIILNQEKKVSLCDMDSAYLVNMEIEKAPDYLIPPEYHYTEEEEKSIKQQTTEASREESPDRNLEIVYPKERITKKFDSWQYGLFLADLFLNEKLGKENEMDFPTSCMFFYKKQAIRDKYGDNLGKYISEEFGLTEPLNEILIGLLDPNPSERLSLGKLASRFNQS